MLYMIMKYPLMRDVCADVHIMIHKRKMMRAMP